MLLSVSRRTDIPAWYADWFFRRLAEGFALVPSPHAPHSRYFSSPSPVTARKWNPLYQTRTRCLSRPFSSFPESWVPAG